MSNPSLLEQENAALRDQIAQLKYYMAGSQALAWRSPDISTGDTIYCEKEKLHDIAAGLIEPGDICVDIGPGLRPQRFLTCNTHILVEPYDVYVTELIKRYPTKLTMNMDGLTFLKLMKDRSVDTIFLLDVIEHLKKEDGHKLLAEAKRVARKQIVIFTPLGFMPMHYSEMGDAWGNVEHNELINHLSGWMPEEFPDATKVVTEAYHEKGFGAFYAIIPSHEVATPLAEGDGPVQTRRLVIVSEANTDFVFHEDDLIIADISLMEMSWVITAVPKRNCIYVPLTLAATLVNEPIELMRSTIVNFQAMENYVNQMRNKVTIGLSSLVVAKKIMDSRTDAAKQ